MQGGPARNSAGQGRLEAFEPSSFRAFSLSTPDRPTDYPSAQLACIGRPPSHPIAALAAHLTTRSPPAHLHRRWRLHFICSCACAHAA